MVSENPGNSAPFSPRASAASRSDLVLRVVSALVLAPLAIVVAFIGGWLFAGFWCVAAVGIWLEWSRMVAGRATWPTLAAGITLLALAGGLAAMDYMAATAATLIGGAVLVGLLAAPTKRSWEAGGVLYAGLVLAAPVIVRSDTDYGFVAVMFLFAIVWTTDILGYFVGRFVGGPKLCPPVSPKKTWSGALGGALGAGVAGLAVVHYAYLANSLAVVGLALLLSATSQAGDLFESAVKRRFGVKDASRVIPGHGGIMDRLDGFLAAATVAAILGLLRGGAEGPARGLLIW